MTDAPKLLFVLGVRLDPQTGREHKLPDRGAEAGEEGIEGLPGVSPTRVNNRFFLLLRSNYAFRSQRLPTGVRCGYAKIPELGYDVEGGEGAEIEEDEKTHIIPNKHTVHKLQPAHHDQKRHEHVNQLHALRRGVEVVLP